MRQSLATKAVDTARLSLYPRRGSDNPGRRKGNTMKRLLLAIMMVCLPPLVHQVHADVIHYQVQIRPTNQDPWTPSSTHRDPNVARAVALNLRQLGYKARVISVSGSWNRSVSRTSFVEQFRGIEFLLLAGWLLGTTVWQASALALLGRSPLPSFQSHPHEPALIEHSCCPPRAAAR